MTPPASARSSRTKPTCSSRATRDLDRWPSTSGPISRPGHSPAGLVFEISDPESGQVALFVGDVIFAGSVGRTDFAGGSFATLEASIVRLYETCPLRRRRCCPGHSGPTTLADELRDQPVPRRRAPPGGRMTPRTSRRPAPPTGCRTAMAHAPRRDRARREEIFGAAGYREMVVPLIEETGAVRPHQRRGLRRRHEGDVLLPRPRRARDLAAARADRRRSSAPTCSTAWRRCRSRCKLCAPATRTATTACSAAGCASTCSSTWRRSARPTPRSTPRSSRSRCAG